MMRCQPSFPVTPALDFKIICCDRIGPYRTAKISVLHDATADFLSVTGD
jgi:hypothetical protein